MPCSPRVGLVAMQGVHLRQVQTPVHLPAHAERHRLAWRIDFRSPAHKQPKSRVGDLPWPGLPWDDNHDGRYYRWRGRLKGTITQEVCGA